MTKYTKEELSGMMRCDLFRIAVSGGLTRDAYYNLPFLELVTVIVAAQDHPGLLGILSNMYEAGALTRQQNPPPFGVDALQEKLAERTDLLCAMIVEGV